MTVIVDLDPLGAQTLRTAVGSDAEVLASVDALHRHLEANPTEDVVVLGPTVDLHTALGIAENMRLTRPSLGVVLVRRRIDTSILADALRAGVREVVEARDLPALGVAVRRTHELSRSLRRSSSRAAEEADAAPRGRVVTVFSAKGGCGKTTLATNLAAVLADHGRRQVCLLDLDLAFGDVAIALQLFPVHTIADAIGIGETLDAESVLALLTPHSPGLTTLVAPVEPGTASSIPAELITRILLILRDTFDYVVVDTPPAFDDQVLAAFDQSDIIVNLATLDIPAIKNLKLTLETLDLLNFPRERWQILLNRADSKVGLSVSEVEKSLGATIAVQIPSSRDVPAATNRGVPIVLDSPRHPVSLAIRKFAEEYVVVAASVDASVPPALRQDRRGWQERYGLARWVRR
jgi:pilus assembly protein CpaE